MTATRRRLLGMVPLVATLAGCGFRPLYSTAGGKSNMAQAGLGATAVALIPERSGQLLRQALQQRFDGSVAGQTKHYELSVAYGIAADALSIQPDSTFTRLRQSATAAWTLRSLDGPSTVLATGLSRALDGANVIDQQYFAADIESETAQARIANTIADQITSQLAAYFVRRNASTA